MEFLNGLRVIHSHWKLKSDMCDSTAHIFECCQIGKVCRNFILWTDKFSLCLDVRIGLNHGTYIEAEVPSPEEHITV